MNKKIKYFSTIVACLAMLCLSVALFDCIGITYVMPHNVAFALAQTDLSSINEKATETDTVEEIGTIQNYPDHYLDKLVYSDGQYRILGDNPIVNIVPKNNFETQEPNVVVGKEYGFFIKSEHKANDFQIFSVLVFDIINSNKISETNDTITVRVKPIYQYRYAYIKNTTPEVYYEGYSMMIKYESASTDCIIPFYNERGTLGQSDSYYLKDICFGGLLRNEQNYNVSDESYSPYKDDGSFFIETDYKYNALYRRQESFTEYFDAEFILDIIDVALGFSGIFSGAKSVVGALGLFVSGGQLAYKAIGMINAATGEAIDMVNVDNGQYTATCLYTTRDGQLENCIGEDGNLGLTKAATLEVQGDDDTGNFWYGVGNYAEAIFRVSNSSVNADDWQTRLTQDIRLTVVDEEGNEYGVNELNGHKVTQNAHEFVINDPVYEHIDIGAKKELRILPDGNNYFTMDARFTGYFNFEFEKDNDYDIYINGEKVVKVNDEYQIYMTSDKTYDIRIFSNVGGIVGFRLMPLRANAKLECK